MPEETWRKQIKSQFGFDQFPGVDQGPEFVHFIGYRPPWAQLRHLRGVAIRQNLTMPSLIGARDAHVMVGPDDPDRVIVSFGEASDSKQAREALVDLLSCMMITNLRTDRDIQTPLGDGGLVGPGTTPDPVLFSSSNVAIHVQLDRGDPHRVMDISKLIDVDISTTPSSTSSEPPPVIEEISIASSNVPIGLEVPFNFKYKDSLEGHALYAKIWTTAGPVFRDNGKLRLTARQAGDHPLRVILVSDDGRVGQSEIKLIVT